VSAPKRLVVPVIRNAESMSMAEIEGAVGTLAKKARDNKLSIEEMTGGTFTITNGGVFGSLMSTPIINIPQSAILGMHKIQDRPMAVNGQVVIRPMMYLALSYDHRIIDGRESVGFLVRVKELLENPLQLLAGTDPAKLLLEL
jgi:2-oxoglutarate dehydrogenase E2 component (dihydrolipoamide succinyltransferase)